jgi:hypothetical protein
MDTSSNLQAYIKSKLEELDQQKDMTEVTLKGKISFGVEAKTYSRLPAWKDLVQKKKSLVKWIWIDAFVLSFFIIGVTGNVLESFEENWIRALASWIMISAVVMLFYMVTSYYTIFYRFRRAEREVRKLIYQDILEKLTQE